MARGLGELLVFLGLNTAEYERGLTKAEVEARKFARNVNSAMLQVGKVLGGLAIGAELFSATKDIIAEAAALNDLADATGATVESLSRLTNQAKIAGTDLATLQSAMLKLSAGMAGTDEESTKAKEALRLLGITTKDPAQAIQEIALKFDTFADGVNKVGLAVALFGKQGGALVPVLKDIANLQDVVGTTTAKQAEEAEKLEQSYRRLSVEATTFKNVILSAVVPALNDLIANFRLAREAGEGFFGAMLRSGTNIDNIADQIKRAADEVARVKQGFAASSRLGLSGVPGFADQKDVDAAIAKYKALIAIRDRAILQGAGDTADQVSRRFLRKPEAPFIPGGGGKTGAEKISESEQLIKSLQKQLEGLQNLTEAEKVLLDFSLGRIKGMTQAEFERAHGIAQQIDATRAATKAEEERKRAQEEALRSEERVLEIQQRAVEAEKRTTENVKQGNESLREQLAFLKGGEEGLRAHTDAILADNIAKSAALEASKIAQGASEAEIASVHATTEAWKEKQQIIGEIRVAEKLRDEAKALQDVKNMISDTFANAFTDFITGAKSAKDAFKSFANDMVQQLSRIAAQNIANAIFGGKSGGGSDFFALLGKLGTAWIGGGAGTGGNWSTPNPDWGMNVRAMGGPVSANSAYWVGEHGAEAFVPKVSGTIVPNNRLRAADTGPRVTIVQNINVPRGADSATLRHEAKRAFALAAAQMRRG